MRYNFKEGDFVRHLNPLTNHGLGTRTTKVNLERNEAECVYIDLENPEGKPCCFPFSELVLIEECEQF
jgi:hypothetical protein